MENNVQLNKLNKTIDAFLFYERGMNCTKNSNIQCEKNSFDLTNEQTFKGLIRIEITYCLENAECSTELFDIEYNK